MQSIWRVNRSFLLLMVIIPLMTLVSLWLYMQFTQTNEYIFKELKNNLIERRMVLFKNYEQYIASHYAQDYQKNIRTSQAFAQKREKELAVLKDDEMQYLYLLYKDKDGKWRYLLDTTEDEEEKALCEQKFDAQSNIWDEALQTHKPQVAQQQNLETLWVSVAYPLVVKGKVVAVLGADFTQNVYENVKQRLKPMEQMFSYVALLMSIMLALAYLLIYLYYKTRKKAFIDPLTQVYNRQYLQEFLKRTSLQNYYLMMVDLDHFKLINDNYGHDAGDIVLIQAVQEMKRHIRQNDLIIRFGGEEFLLFIHKKETQDVTKVANRLREKIEQLNIQTQNNTLQITISIGINPSPYSFKNIDDAVKIADEQLYRAKTLGRNRVEVYNANKNYKTQTAKRISDIQEAIDDDRVKCAFQPMYAHKGNAPLKYEMLLRLLDKENNIVSPDAFLPFIRNTQVYVSLTNKVIEIAMNALEKEPYHLSINLDLQDLLNEDIMQLLQSKFSTRADLAQRLTIEILEHEQIENFARIKSQITLLKELGFRIALDDFGSGYANFSYLVNLDFDILKIDGTIVQEIDTNPSAYHIVKTMCSFAKGMGMQIVAEQIETKEVLTLLQELEVDYFQGYYLGRPAFEFSDPFSK